MEQIIVIEDKDKTIALLRKQYKEATGKISALEQEVSLLECQIEILRKKFGVDDDELDKLIEDYSW
jgi:chromosome segregation ATPase